MSEIPGTRQHLRLLVNCKTYPAVSTKYTETVCTGGVEPTGEFVRLYPIPFRFLPSEMQYRRWDVIDVKAYRSTNDQRPESWHLVPGSTIAKVDTVTNERHRWDWMQPTVFPSRQAMADNGLTNGCVQIEPVEIWHEPDNREWSTSQRNVIAQGDLFATPAQKSAMAQRVPHQFRLKYRELTTGAVDEGKVLAWSYYAGYLRNRGRGMSVTAALNAVIESVKTSIFEPQRAVFGIFGTHSRFGHWMISGIYHLPKEVTESRGLL